MYCLLDGIVIRLTFIFIFKMAFKSEKIPFPLYGTPGKSVTRSGAFPNYGGVHCTGILGRVAAKPLQPGHAGGAGPGDSVYKSLMK